MTRKADLSSGVLAASIERSRHKWLSDAIFERYWKKPIKKETVPSNPAKETMVRLGTCSMVIEPHVFDIVLYSVKDLPAVALSYGQHFPPPTQYSPFSQTQSYSPPVYSGPFTGTHHSNGSQHHKPISQQSLPPFREAFAGAENGVPSPAYNRPPPTAPTGVSNASRSSSISNKGGRYKSGEANGDPVIQVLATRAASDSSLKELMTVVASGLATPEQLKEFQAHIDEINSSLDRKKQSPDVPIKSTEDPEQPMTGKPPLTQESHEGISHPPSLSQVGSNPSTISYPPDPMKPHLNSQIKHEPQVPHSYPAIPYNAPRPRPIATQKPDVHSLVFDFNTNGDRYKIPRLSILDYLPGNTQVLISFLVVRRGDTAASKAYKPTKMYYQPVTLRLSAQRPNILEPLARIVAPPDEVRKYMNETMDKHTPAEEVFLATRLPKAKEGIDGSTETEQNLDAKEKDLFMKAFYGPPSSLAPLVA